MFLQSTISENFIYFFFADLLRELTAASSENLNVTSIMDTWTRQKGFPVLKLQKLSNGHYVATQERFLASQNDSSENDQPSPFNYKWDIPISYILSNKPEVRSMKWLYLNEPSVTM